ncbi:hypothetical protein JKP88DRAFT_198269 [Tribonema minus]|uniref:Uncharacterized protein n=1 Tax=Tribonema minus TaxID=303371 RepID=A0A835Z712_9STRA|nr:hypothetical protein JKP88DRAFT_198269 [Tribonema minus]
MRLGQQLTGVGEDVIKTLLEHSEEFAKLVRKDWKLRTQTEAPVLQRAAKEVWSIAKAAANAARFERELDENYGPFKDFILHPTVQWIMAVAGAAWREFHLFGRRPLPLVGTIMTLIMMARAKQPLGRILLAVAILSGMHPLLLGIAAFMYFRAMNAPRKPRGYEPFTPREPLEKGGDILEDPFHPSKLDESGYDVIVIGSTISGLLTAALLARVGKRVLVLESAPRVGGAAVVTVGDGTHEFETVSPAVGSVQRYARLLAAAAHPSAPPLQWFPVGAAQGGSGGLRVHKVVHVGARGGVVLHPAGRARLQEALCAQYPEERERVEAFFASMLLIAGASAASATEKVFGAATAARVARVAGDAYASFASKPVSAVLDKVTDSAGLRAALISLFSTENLPHEEVAAGAYVREVAQSLDGAHYPRGGWRAVAAALLPAVEAAGGRVLTRAPPHARVFTEGGRAAGVTLRTGGGEGGGGELRVRVREGGCVVSALGAIETFETLLSDDDAKAHGGRFPAGFGALRAARPRLHLCVGLAGNWDEALDATPADYLQVRDDGAARAHERYHDQDSEWLRVSFASAKDPERWWSAHTACVVTCELPDDVLRASAAAGGTLSAGAGGSGANAGGGVSARVKDRMKERMQRRLHEIYPATRGAEEVVEAVLELRPGLSATCARAAAPGLRAPTHVPGLFLASADLCENSFAGGLDAAWIATHAVLGYTPFDFLILKRTLLSDLETLR